MSVGVLLLFAAGGVLLIVGAELLVRGASRLAIGVGISPLVVGLTVVAFGTSAPELAVTVGSSYAGQSDLAVGNVVGSNIFNILLILGISALIAPLFVRRQLIRLEAPLMIAASVLMLLLALDGRIGRLDGLLLFAGVVAYTVFMVRHSRRQAPDLKSEPGEAFEGENGGRWALPVNLGLIAIGLAGLVLGARWLVDGAVAIAVSVGVSELVIGLTVVAAGTSLPEVATSVLASLRGERDIAVGNVVGSFLFNILAVLGLGSLVAPAGIPVAPGALAFDIPVMIAVAVATLPVFFTGHIIARWEGAVFLAYYVAYTTYLVLDSVEHHALDEFGTALLWFVLPLTVLTMVVIGVRASRGEGSAADGTTL